jgi:peptidyl-prolyl cis-trans isomerase B (cyclophilin B)
VAGKDRKKELARQRYERQQQRREARQARARRTKLIGIVGAVVVVLAAGGVALAATTGGGKKHATASSSPKPVASPTVATSCTYAKVTPPSSIAKDYRNVGMPPAKPDTTDTLVETLKTNRGDIVIDLANKNAACTVNSMRYLASKNFFNNTHCHRLTTTGIYVLQCGDPSATGDGGPTYKFNDENAASATYPAGTVAMANSGANTNGSQFFVVYKDSTSGLGKSYTVWGHVVKGLDIVQAVAKAGSDNSNGSGDGHPKESVVIQSVTITKK